MPIPKEQELLILKMLAAQRSPRDVQMQRLIAGDKPLEAPDIIHELVSQTTKHDPYAWPRMIEFLLKAAPMVSPLAKGLGGVEAIPSALGKPTSTLEALKGLTEKAPPTHIFDQPGGPPTEMAGNIFDQVTTHLPLGSGRTEQFQSELQKLYPGVPDVTESLTHPPVVEPLKRPTEPLARYQAYNPEGRFHGTKQPIEQIISPEQAPWAHGRIKGKGLYTSNEGVITDTYAGLRQGAAEAAPGAVRYKVHQIKPVQWLNDDRPFPKRLIERMKRSIVNPEPGDEKSIHYGLQNMPKPGETVARWVVRQAYNAVGDEETIYNHIQEWASEEGYGGLRYPGGKLTGGRRHDARVYWHPEEQIKVRPTKGSFGGLKVPKESPTLSKAPKPKYFRDPLKTKKLTLP